MKTPFLRTTRDGLLLTIRLQPGAKRSELAGLHDDALKIRIAAPPVDGAANRELIRFLSELLEIAPGRVTLVRGQAGRRKLVRVQGIQEAEARSLLLPGR